jgi:hypothetical protein
VGDDNNKPILIVQQVDESFPGVVRVCQQLMHVVYGRSYRLTRDKRSSLFVDNDEEKNGCNIHT